MQIAVKTFLVLFGLAFVALGYYMGVVMAGDLQADGLAARQLEPAGSAVLASSAPGTRLLVEGSISNRNPVRFRDFVAYIRQEFRGADGNGDEKWIEDERVTPRLLIEAQGLVQLANEDYLLTGPHERWQEEGLNWSSRTQEGTRRYAGLVVGRPVMTIGVVVPGTEGNVLQAELVYGGTRQAYIDGQLQAAGWLPWVGLAVGLAGAGIVVLATWGLRSWR